LGLEGLALEDLVADLELADLELADLELADLELADCELDDSGSGEVLLIRFAIAGHRGLTGIPIVRKQILMILTLLCSVNGGWIGKLALEFGRSLATVASGNCRR
jgi:hypothetical protein